MKNQLLLFLLLALWQAQSYSQSVLTIHGVIGGDDQTESTPAKWNDLIKANEYFLAFYNEVPTANDLELLRSNGYQIVSFVPPASYILTTTNKQPNTRYLKSVFTEISSIPVALKMSKQVYATMQNNASFKVQEFIVSCYKTNEVEKLKNYFSDNNIRCRSNKWLFNNSVIVRIPEFETLQKIAASPIVSFIETYKGEPLPETSSNSLFSNQIYALNYDRIGPNGRNTYFSNIEHFGGNSLFRINAKGRNHPAFGTNYPDNIETLSLSHGSAVSLYGAASNNVDEYDDRGMAEGSIMVQMPRYDEIVNYYTNHNLSPLTLNVSAGVGGNSVEYNEAAKEFDRITRTLGGFILCFAAGNNGSVENTSLDYGPGWANISGNDKTTKNNFTVHAGGAPGEHYDWACKGPTADGRLKPDICAEGQYGTSFASPNLAGLVNCLFESYADSYQSSPRSDVVKAVILNTAIDADKPGIDFKTGFGTVNPIGAHRAIQEKRIVINTLEQGSGDQHSFTLSVPANQRQLKVLLYWHDAEGTPGAGKALVNDLDLEIVAPNGNILFPWTLDPTPGKHYDLPVRKKDDLNNVEQITLTDPPAGDYIIHIKGTQVVLGPQDFVVTYEIEPYYIEITSPAENFRTARNKTVLFTWNSALDTSANQSDLDVLLETESGVSQLGAVPAWQHYYSYTIPGNFPFTNKAKIIVRQSNSGIADTSHYFHVMHTPTGLKMKDVCPDELSFQWDPIDIPGTRYLLYHLGEQYMEPVSVASYPEIRMSISADTILGPGKSFGPEDWFAIASQHPDGALSLRSSIISTQQTNLLNAGTYIQKNYTLCFGDSITVKALDLEKDSIRWFRNDLGIQGATEANLKIKGSEPGFYYYKIYQSNGCDFTSDTFTVSSPLDISDTLSFGPKVWNVFVFRDNDKSQYYGKMVMEPLSIHSLQYYTEFEQINKADSYIGCPPGLIYTILYKRKGFTKGHYKFDLGLIQEKMLLYIDGELVYTSPSNFAGVGIIWEGELDENSEVRIKHFVRGRALMDLEITPSDHILPAGIEDGLIMWLEGDHVKLDQDENVEHWLDKYIFSKQNRSDPAANIKIEEASLNFHDVLRFNGQSGIFGKTQATGFSNQATMFGVFKMDETSDANARVFGFGLPPYYIDNNYSGTFSPFYRNENGSEIGLYRNGNGFFPSGNKLNQWQLLSASTDLATTSIYSFGEKVLDVNKDFSGLFYRTYSIGCRPDTSTIEGQMRGEIAELLLFERTLTLEEQQRINSYLAIKYGLPLKHDYVARNGDVVYNQVTHPFRISGLAREDKMEWSQKQSGQDNFIGSTGPVYISNKLNPVNLQQDSSYLLWGDDGNEAEYFIFLNDSTAQMMRTWKLQHSGSAGSFRFNFDLTSGWFTAENSRYQLKLSNSPLPLSTGEYIPLDFYNAPNQKQYAFVDYSLTQDTVLYFTLVRVERQTSVSTADPNPTGIQVTPNPFRDRVTLNELNDGDRVVLYDIQGKMVFEKESSGSILTLSDLPQTSVIVVVYRKERIVHSESLVRVK